MTAAPVESKRIIVGAGQLAVSAESGDVLSAFSLGSCLSVAVYDPLIRVGGLLHVLLPESSLSPTRASTAPATFVDTGVPALFHALYALGAEKYRTLIYVIGGAQIIDDAGVFNIGRRNYDALTVLLHKHNLRIRGEHVGGGLNRSVALHIATGKVLVRTTGQAGEIAL